MSTREELLESAEAELARAQDARNQAIAEAEARLKEAQEAVEAAKKLKSSIWPKRKSVLLGEYGDIHQDLYDEAEFKWGMTQSDLNTLSGMLYEVEVVVDINSDGSYKVVGFWHKNDGEVCGWGEKGEIRW